MDAKGYILFKNVLHYYMINEQNKCNICSYYRMSYNMNDPLIEESRKDSEVLANLIWNTLSIRIRNEWFKLANSLWITNNDVRILLSHSLPVCILDRDNDIIMLEPLL